MKFRWIEGFNRNTFANDKLNLITICRPAVKACGVMVINHKNVLKLEHQERDPLSFYQIAYLRSHLATVFLKGAVFAFHRSLFSTCWWFQVPYILEIDRKHSLE